jgi:hypothetical protein
MNRMRDELRRRSRRPDSTDVDGQQIAGGDSPLEQAIGREALELTCRSSSGFRSLNGGGLCDRPSAVIAVAC